jgi:hypothetical protein
MIDSLQKGDKTSYPMEEAKSKGSQSLNPESSPE